MAVLAQQLLTDSFGTVASATAKAQTFDIGVSNATVTKLSLYLKRADLISSGTYRISIRPTDGGAPAEPLPGAEEDLWSEDFDSSSIGDTYEWVEFTSGLNLELTASTTYAILVKMPTGTAALHVGNKSSNVYGDGQRWNSANRGDTSFTTLVGDDTFIIEGSTAPRQVILSSPANTSEEIILQPLLEWGIDGTGAEEGDFLFIYLRKDNANFTDDDLLQGFVNATLNSSLQIVAGLEYITEYFWQVQAASEDADLLDSEVWSFLTTDFYPPAPSFDAGLGYITGRSNMITVKRVIAAAANKIWYEDDNG